MSFNFYKHAQGIGLRVGGYSDKQTLLLQRLLSSVVEPNFSQRRFDDIRSDMIRSLKNAVAQRPSSQVVDDLNESLVYGQWGEKALISALETTDLSQLDGYIRQFWRSASAEALIYGNYEAGRGHAIVSDVAGYYQQRPGANVARAQGAEAGCGRVGPIRSGCSSR